LIRSVVGVTAVRIYIGAIITHEAALRIVFKAALKRAVKFSDSCLLISLTPPPG
jgi:hypothetical protein